MSTDIQKLTNDVSSINDGKFSTWQGLDLAWTKSNLLKISEELPCNNYDLDGRKLSRCLFSLVNQPQPLQCFIDENESVVLLRLEDVSMVPSPNELIQDLGTPDASVILSGDYIYAPAKQIIYADRGITLYILGDHQSETAMLMAVSLYKQTSIEDYKNHLGGKETMKFFND